MLVDYVSEDNGCDGAVALRMRMVARMMMLIWETRPHRALRIIETTEHSSSSAVFGSDSTKATPLALSHVFHCFQKRIFLCGSDQ